MSSKENQDQKIDFEVVSNIKKCQNIAYLPFVLLFGVVGVGCMISTGSFDKHIRNSFDPKYHHEGKVSKEYWTAASVMFSTFGFIATFLSIPIVKLLGNKENSIIGFVAGLCGGVLLILSYSLNSYVCYFLCRALHGYSAGALCTSCIVHIYQLVHPSKHWILSIVVQASINLGIFITGIFSLKEIVNDKWFVQAFPVLVAFSLGLIIVLVLPKSPLSVYEKTKDLKSVTRILSRIRNGSPQDIEEEAQNIAKQVNENENIRGVSTIQMLQNKELIFPLLIVVLNGAFQQLSGINASIFYGSTIMQGMMEGREDAANCILFTFCLLGSLVLSPFPKLLGSKRVLYIGYFFMAISFYISFGLKHTENKAYDLANVFLLSFFAFMFQLGPGPVPLSLFSVYFNCEYHSSAQNLAQVANWVSNLLVSSSFIPIEDQIKHKVLLMFAIACSIFSVILVLFMADPKGKTPDQIKEAYDRSLIQFSL